MRRRAGMTIVLVALGGCLSTDPGPENSAQITYDYRKPAPVPARTTWGQFDPSNPSYFQQGAFAATARVPSSGYDPRLAARTYAASPPATGEQPLPSHAGVSDRERGPATASLPPPSFDMRGEDAKPAVTRLNPAARPVSSEQTGTPRLASTGAAAKETIAAATAPASDTDKPGTAVKNPSPAPAAQPLSAAEGGKTKGDGATAATPSPRTEAAIPAEASPSVRLVNNKRIHLNYKVDNVGASGVSSVELWYTRDGRAWKKYEEKSQSSPPYVVDVPDEGLYGFTLVAHNGLGIGKAPPQAGDLPQVWVAVDLTKPNVRLLAVEPGSDAKAGNIVICWSASDKNLDPRPITLSYAEQANGPWTPIMANLENTGRYIWQVPAKLPGRFLVRVEASDLAGNVGSAESKDPVALDLSQPTTSIVAVDSAGK